MRFIWVNQLNCRWHLIKSWMVARIVVELTFIPFIVYFQPASISTVVKWRRMRARFKRGQLYFITKDTRVMNLFRVTSFAMKFCSSKFCTQNTFTVWKLLIFSLLKWCRCSNNNHLKLNVGLLPNRWPALFGAYTA